MGKGPKYERYKTRHIQVKYYAMENLGRKIQITILSGDITLGTF
jgi:hypothetical protein